MFHVLDKTVQLSHLRQVPISPASSVVTLESRLVWNGVFAVAGCDFGRVVLLKRAEQPAWLPAYSPAMLGYVHGYFRACDHVRVGEDDCKKVAAVLHCFVLALVSCLASLLSSVGSKRVTPRTLQFSQRAESPLHHLVRGVSFYSSAPLVPQRRLLSLITHDCQPQELSIWQDPLAIVQHPSLPCDLYQYLKDDETDKVHDGTRFWNLQEWLGQCKFGNDDTCSLPSICRVFGKHNDVMDRFGVWLLSRRVGLGGLSSRAATLLEAALADLVRKLLELCFVGQHSLMADTPLGVQVVVMGPEALRDAVVHLGPVLGCARTPLIYERLATNQRRMSAHVLTDAPWKRPSVYSHSSQTHARTCFSLDVAMDMDLFPEVGMWYAIRRIFCTQVCSCHCCTAITVTHCNTCRQGALRPRNATVHSVQQ
jgi:hypothetical protein